MLGRTPLHYACESGQDDTLELLLNHGANPNVVDTATKKSPLHVSIENGQFNAVTILCKSSKELETLCRNWDSDGQSVLHYAAVT